MKSRALQHLINGGWLLAANVATVLAAYGVMVLIARRLGAADFGDYTFALAYGSLFATLPNFGVDRILVRQVSQDPGASGSRLAAAGTVRLSLSLVAVILAAAVGYWQGYGARLVVITALCGLSLLLNQFSELFRSVLYASGAMSVEATVRLVGRIVTVMSAGAAVFGGWGIQGACLGVAIGGLVELAGYMTVVPRRISGSVVPTAAGCNELLRQSLPLAANTILVVVYFRINLVLIRGAKGAEVAGWFGAAFAFLQLLQLVSGTVASVTLPLLSKQVLVARERVRATVESLGVALVVLAAGLSVCLGMFAQELIQIVYGSQYVPSVAALRIMAWANVPMFMGSLFATALVSLDRQRVLVGVPLVAVLVSVPLNLALIPRFGLLGASAATLVTESAVAIMMLACLKASLGTIRMGAPVLKVLAGTLAAILVAALARQVPWGGRLCLVILCYGTVTLLLRVVPHGEWFALVRASRR